MTFAEMIIFLFQLMELYQFTVHRFLLKLSRLILFSKLQRLRRIEKSLKQDLNNLIILFDKLRIKLNICQTLSLQDDFNEDESTETSTSQMIHQLSKVTQAQITWIFSNINRGVHLKIDQNETVWICHISFAQELSQHVCQNSFVTYISLLVFFQYLRLIFISIKISLKI